MPVTRACYRRAGRALVGAGLLLAGLAVGLGGQALQFHHLGTEDGLASPWVDAILRDSRGYMWFGTANGLNRYDGYDMVRYRHQRARPQSLEDNRILALYEDRAGAIWVGTRSGLSRYDRASDTFTNYMVQEGLAPAQRRAVLSLLEDRRGTFWVGTGAGLYRFDRGSGRARPFALASPADTVGRIVQALYEDRAGHLWICTQSDGLYELEPGTGALRHYREGAVRPEDRIPDNDVRAVVEDSAGLLWIGTYNRGLMRVDLSTGHRDFFRHDPADPRSLSVDRVSRLTAPRRGGLWVATENGGLDYYDPAWGQFFHNRADPNNPLALNSDAIGPVYEDPLATLWVGTFSGGVNVLKRGGQAIRHYRSIAGDSTSLGGNSVLGFSEDTSGVVWVATDGGGLDRFDPWTGRFRRYTTANSNLNRDAVLAVEADPAGGVWVGTWGGGLSHLDETSGRFTTYTRQNSDLPDDNIFSLHVDRAGRLWVGTWREGLLRLDRRTGRFTRFRIDSRGPQSQIWQILELRDGRLALATLENGLVLFDPASGQVRSYGVDARAPTALASYEVRALLEGGPDTLWVGTASGLDRLDLRRQTVRHFTEDDGLASSLISGLAPGPGGRVWISTDAGITRLDPASGRTWQYTTADGLQGRHFNPRAMLHTRAGALFFGGNNGFNVIWPQALVFNRRPPPVRLTGLELFNRPQAPGRAGSPLVRTLGETRQLTLHHDQSVFTLHFTALDYTAPSKNRYAYRLEGFDPEWVYAGASRSATYTNLPPGRYVFRVRASNNDGVWNNEGARLAIVITPAWWQTWTFRLALVLLLGAGLALLLARARRRHRQLHAMNARLTEAAEHDRQSQQYLEGNVLEILEAMQRFAEGDYSVALPVQSEDAIGKLRQGFNTVVADRQHAEEELRQSQKMEAVGRLAGGVAHDFNNLLTVIKGNTGLALADLQGDGPARQELKEIEHAAERASSLTRQLLAFSRKQLLQPRLLALNDVVRDMARLLRRSVGEDIELQLLLDPTVGQVRADRGQLEQVLLNLAVNARDAMPRGGSLRIETTNAEPARLAHLAEAEPGLAYVALAMRDTGSGMEPDVQQRIFEPFFTTKELGKGTGLGLSTVYGSVKQSGGFIQVESRREQGSTFTVYLPRVDQAPAPAAGAARIPEPPSACATILLVEDEDAVRRLASRVLERRGYSVLAAANGPAALQLASGHDGPIHLLFTDIVMPGMSGRELAEQLQPLRPDMRVLYTSGYTEDAIVRHGVSTHTAAFLQKPFTPEELLQSVSCVLES